MIIYKAENKVNGKVYIGQTIKNIDKRISEHLKSEYSCGIVFRNALKKYGIQSFEISIIDKGESREELNEKEKYWIKFYNCKVPDGYNLTNGGNGIIGYIFTPEVRKKIGDSIRGKKNPIHSEWMKKNNPNKKLEVREKMGSPGKSNGRFGKHWSEEERKMISEKTKQGMKNSRAAEKISKKCKGRIPWNKKLIEANNGNKV